MADHKRSFNKEIMAMRCHRKRKATMLLMDHLPIEIVVDILVRLPTKSLARIRSVSKTLSQIVDSLYLARRHTLSLINATSCSNVEAPRLLLIDQTRHSGNDIATLQSLTFDEDSNTFTNGKYTFRASVFSSELIDHVVSFVFYNLLCLAYDDYHCLLIDPLSRDGKVLMLPTSENQHCELIKGPRSGSGEEEALVLPAVNTRPYHPDKPDTIVEHRMYGMGYDSINNTYKIVRVSDIRKRGRYGDYLKVIGRVAHILELGGTNDSDSWREIPSVPHRYIYCHWSVCAYGDMHWLTKTRKRRSKEWDIVSFDFKKEEFYMTPKPSTLRQALGYFERVYSHCGDLFMFRRTN